MRLSNPPIQLLSLFLAMATFSCQLNTTKNYSLSPTPSAKGINPDTHLKLTFSATPVLGDSGMIRVFDADTGELVDSLDMSIPPGPTESDKSRPPYTPEPYDYAMPVYPTNRNTIPGTPSGLAVPTPDSFQLTIIGGFSDGFHFYPVIIHDSVAMITLHHNLLDYGKTYYVQIDDGVLNLPDGSFHGIEGKEWTFSTKEAAPSLASNRLVVAADGSGDFNTVQGAIDFVPDDHEERIEIFIKVGVYEEIVYFRNKENVTFMGEDRESTIIQYANNEVFNPHPANISTNEWPGTFPSRRAAFSVDNCRGIHLENLTIISINPKPAQAEGLLIMGEENVVRNVSIIGSGDALQANGSLYMENSSVTGFGDNILGRGPGFYKDCEFISSYGPHMWIRNTEANHGNVFVDCIFRTEGDAETVISRAPDNKGYQYPYSEAVLINCQLEGVQPEGFGPVSENHANVRYWEYNSTSLEDGTPVDMSQRHPVVRELTMPEDSEWIRKYSDPAFVLGGWKPEE